MPTNVSIDHSSQHQSGTVADGRWLVPTFVVLFVMLLVIFVVVFVTVVVVIVSPL